MASNFKEMAKKTALKRVFKYAPLKSEFVCGLAADETIKTALFFLLFAEVALDAETGEVMEGEAHA